MKRIQINLKNGGISMKQVPSDWSRSQVNRFVEEWYGQRFVDWEYFNPA
jgi:hypothetical protein